MNTLSRKLAALGIAALIGVGLIVFFILRGSSAGDRQLAEARVAIQEREFETALKILDRHLEQKPGDMDALLLAAQTARRAKAYGRAAKYLQRHAEHRGSREEASREERLLKAQEGDADLAEVLLRDCEGNPASPDNFLPLEAVAVASLAAFEWKLRSPNLLFIGPEVHRGLRAANALIQTPMARADRAEAYLLSGNIHRIAMKHERAVADLRQAVELAPSHFGARHSLVETIFQDNPAEAIAHLEVLHQQRPDDLATLYALGSLRRNLGRTVEAIAALDRLIELQPGKAQFLVERANVELDVDRIGVAEGYLRRAAELSNDYPETFLALSHCARAKGQPEEAERFLKQYRELKAQAEQNRKGPKSK